jgi:hypothetical protein
MTAIDGLRFLALDLSFARRAFISLRRISVSAISISKTSNRPAADLRESTAIAQGGAAWAARRW